MQRCSLFFVLTCTSADIPLTTKWLVLEFVPISVTQV